MRKFFYLPLDERPCNRLFPRRMAASCGEVELLTVPDTLLGHKKSPADVEGIWKFLEEKSKMCDSAVLSAEMLFFGGLLPSRIHHLPEEWIGRVTQRLVQLKENNPALDIYLFQLIMRTPRYDSSEEEPDYYAQYGKLLFRRAYLEDKKTRAGLEPEEETEYRTASDALPSEIRRDYEWRRRYNLRLLEEVLTLVERGVVKILYIPQDDSCEYGYTAMDQHRIQQKIRSMNLQGRVYLHPGADEAGAELLARAYLDGKKQTCRVHVLYGSILAPRIIPLYEDRILGASVEQHLLACGCLPCETPEQADLILAVNAPGRVMQESKEQSCADVTYQTFRCQNLFVQRIAELVRGGKRVAVADCAYANGGELDLIVRLDAAGILDKLISYKGWNTACNTIGTSLAQGIFALDTPETPAVKANLAYHLVDDVFYQAVVRARMEREAETRGANYFDLNNCGEILGRLAAEQIRSLWQQVIQRSFADSPAQPAAVFFPWNRLFEIGVTLENDLCK